MSEKSSCVRFAALSNGKHSRAVREKAVWRGFFSKGFVLLAAVASLVLVGCSSPHYRTAPIARTGTVRMSTLHDMESLNMDRAAPILIRIYKEESTLEVWKQDRTGRFALLKAYPICKFSGKLGPKLAQGDYQAPEGFYDITPDQMNPWSHEYLAFNTGFPNAFDRSPGRTGSFLMVHGGCESVGCYAMTDYEMKEIYGLADEAFKGGQDKIQLEAFPFQMTAENLARHTDDPNTPFWDMLKKGSDAFLGTGQPPKVAVCGQHYAFNPVLADNDLDPRAPCPPGIESTPVAGAEQSPQLAPAVANQSDVMAYQNDDPIAREIEKSFRGVH
jgi:murein L,D-transpeptidase YafK